MVAFSKQTNYICRSKTVVESAGNETRSTVSLPRLGSGSLQIHIVLLLGRSSQIFSYVFFMDESCDLFVLYKQYLSGGKIWLMMGLETTGSDYDDILAIAKYLAESGHEVKILHAVHYKDPIYREVYGELIGTKYYRKCPDLLVDGDFVEYESFKSDQPKNAFRNMLHNGLAQSDSVILRHCNLTDGYMMRKILSKREKGVDISTVWIFNGQELKTLYKTEG